MNSNIDDYKKYNESFFENFLSNYYKFDTDEEYFNKILDLNENDSRIETIWIYHKEYLKEMGFNYKSDIKIFENHFDNIKIFFHPYDAKLLFDFRAKNIRIIFDTGENSPNKKVFIKINKNEKIEYLLEKELYKYSSLYNVDYIKIDDVLLNNYIENREEVIQLVKLFDY